MTNLLKVENLVVKTKTTTIIDKACLEVFENEIVALVGESGSGKSMIARSIMGLLPSEQLRISSGSIQFQGNELLDLKEGAIRKIRGRSIAYIPQSPLTALNPMMSVGRQLFESFDPQFHETAFLILSAL
jgi:ABC-type dipeptide/oligopeptide/nickel transport system ATPase component